MSAEILDPVTELVETSPSRRRPGRSGGSAGPASWSSHWRRSWPSSVRCCDPSTPTWRPRVCQCGAVRVPLARVRRAGPRRAEPTDGGARTTIFGAAFVSIISIAIGTTLAIATAWFGGRFDTIVSAGINVVFAFPGILLAVVAAAVFGPSLFSAGLALSIAYSPYVARVLRGAALQQRAMAYIAALEVQGFGAWRLCVRHLLPNICSLIVAQGTILFGFAMVDLAAISFLGLGVQSPQADWGVMVSEGKTGLLQGFPLVSLSATVCIVVVVAAVSFLGDRLEASLEGRPSMSALLEVRDLTVGLQMDSGVARSSPEPPCRSPRARPSGSSASPAPASR